eukprot:1157402-Pelagomonas_calceolata.AAC.4
MGLLGPSVVRPKKAMLNAWSLAVLRQPAGQAIRLVELAGIGPNQTRGAGGIDLDSLLLGPSWMCLKLLARNGQSETFHSHVSEILKDATILNS